MADSKLAANVDTRADLVFLHLSCPGVEVDLLKPLQASLYKEGDDWICASELLAVSALGETKSEAVHAFQEDHLCILWLEVGQAETDALTQGAKVLQRRLREFMH